ncbi:MAG: DUF2461 domain-containing protein [Clostridia bacterium]|nr:DUF2461 domain-containing protein [Clostridia bacterium]MBR5942428.1 DUF2461 domain-containing protein [Clostridia bacterium]
MPITQKTLDFLAENRFRNSKQWYDEHRSEYLEYVFEPLAAIVCDLSETMKAIDDRIVCVPKVGGSISRLRRDTRYSNDKSLYRRNIWLYFGRKGDSRVEHPGFYVDISPEGIAYGCGYYWAGADVCAAVREMALADDPAFLAAAKAYEAQSVFAFGGETYKKPHYPDEPERKRLWLEKRNYNFFTVGGKELLFSPDLSKTFARDFPLLAPVYRFLLKAETPPAALHAKRPEFEF